MARRFKKNPSFDEIKKRFTRFLQQSEHSPLTIKSYLSDVGGFAKWFHQTNGDELAPELITPTDLQEYKRFLAEGLELKPQTTNRKLIALKCFLTWSDQAGLTDGIPTIPKPVPFTKTGTEHQWLNRREKNSLLRAVEKGSNPRDVAIIKLFLHTGVRASELCALTWSDVVIAERKGKLIVRKGKGGKYREIPLNNDARNALRSLGYAELGGMGLPIFTGQRGKLGREAVFRIVSKYAETANLENVGCHTLRHTFGKDLHDAGIPREEIADLLGHASLDTTRIYTKSSFRELEQAVERIEEGP